MSHSQFRCIKTYTETCMDESLRQAYDYWQDQPGSIRRLYYPHGFYNQLLIKLSSTQVNSCVPKHTRAKFCFRKIDDSRQTRSSSRIFASYTEQTLSKNTWHQQVSTGAYLLRASVTPSVPIQASLAPVESHSTSSS